MHVPRYFVEDRVEVLHAAIREAGLATLVLVIDHISPGGACAARQPSSMSSIES
jgi:predicted FMN-binding regulatory protein PaiB